VGEHTRVELADRLAEAADRQQRCEFEAARDELLAALHEADAHGDADGLGITTARRMLAEVLRELGDLAGARRIAGALVVDCAGRYGDTHPATVRALAVLARVLHDLGDLRAAERMYRRILDGRISEDGPAGRPVRLARANLALLYRDRGDLTTAHSLLGAAYAVHRRAYGTEDPDTIRIGFELARLDLAIGDPGNARRLLTVAYAGCQARFGETHPLTRAVERCLVSVEPAMPSAPVSAVPAGPGAPTVRPPARRRLPRAVLVGMAALLALAVGFVAVAAVQRSRAGTTAPPATLSGRVPVGVRLDDAGRTITLSWLDPPDGPAPIVVAVAEDGRPARVVATLPAGTQRYVLDGVDPTHEYCLIVAAVYPGEPQAAAASVCTLR
jgi:Tetratricopeptide repeat